MNGRDLSCVSDKQLVELFEHIAIEMSKCELTVKYNRLASELEHIWDTLHSRGHDATRKLLPLLSHANRRVRYWTAAMCHDDAPTECNQALRELTKERHPGVAMHAELLLMERDPKFREEFSKHSNRRYGC
ncbi:MAG TPA: DUF2019 domain-containing protein [Alphaproteobacteria bacterium]|nr:DUF2019 domain-containing protein [Alphaproteobacteria bacterium]